MSDHKIWINSICILLGLTIARKLVILYAPSRTRGGGFIWIQTGTTQQTRYMDPMFDWCWASVADAGTTLIQHRIMVSCLPGLWMDRFSQIMMDGGIRKESGRELLINWVDRNARYPCDRFFRYKKTRRDRGEGRTPDLTHLFEYTWRVEMSEIQYHMQQCNKRSHNFTSHGVTQLPSRSLRLRLQCDSDFSLSLSHASHAWHVYNSSKTISYMRQWLSGTFSTVPSRSRNVRVKHKMYE